MCSETVFHVLPMQTRTVKITVKRYDLVALLPSFGRRKIKTVKLRSAALVL